MAVEETKEKTGVGCRSFGTEQMETLCGTHPGKTDGVRAVGVVRRGQEGGRTEKRVHPARGGLHS